jgi:hypothetical protein
MIRVMYRWTEIRQASRRMVTDKRIRRTKSPFGWEITHATSHSIISGSRVGPLFHV